MIDVIIPNWNGRKFLGTCLDSLQRQSYQSFRVILVDNGSTDDSIPFIKSNYPDLVIEILELSENRGFSTAVNRGILASSSDWILLLNNDVEVAENCLENIVAVLKKKKEYDFFALKMIDFNDRSKLDGAGDAVLRGGVGYRLGTMETDSTHYSISRDVFGACAGAALYRRSLFDDIGLFDEDFFAYLEDVDFNLRAARAGKRCCYIPHAHIFHIGSGSSGSKINSLTVRLTTRNNVYVVLKNFDPLLFLFFVPPLLVYQLFWLLFVIKKGQVPAYIRGLLESARTIPEMYRKHRSNRQFVELSFREYKKRIIDSERQAILSIMNRRRQLGKGNGLFELYLKLFC